MSASSSSDATSGSNPRATDRMIVTTRVFAAPREKLFLAFSDPAQLAQWWGPQGFTSTFQTFDLRPGGVWQFVMHGPDGTDYPNENRFVEIITPRRIVFEHRQAAHNFQTTMFFVEETEGTRLTWRMAFESSEDFSQHKEFIAAANEQNFDRLAAHLVR